MKEDIVTALKSQIGDDVQKIYDHEALFKRAVNAITELREDRLQLLDHLEVLIFHWDRLLNNMDCGDEYEARVDAENTMKGIKDRL